MVKSVTIDSSVIISSLLPNEKRHEEARQIWGKVLSGETPAVMPYSVLVEVVASIRRRTGSELLAVEVQKTLEGIPALSFVMLDSRTAAKTCRIATKTGLRGMDALVVQVAKEYKAELITFDYEMLQKSASVLLKA
jgi:predicted nucleic acid-binding protein